VAERDAGQRLDLEVLERAALRGSEAAHLLLREGDVAAQLVVDLLRGGGDRRVVDDERLRLPRVELARVVADAVDPVALDAREHLRDGPAHLLRDLLAVEGRLLEVLGHGATVSRS